MLRHPCGTQLLWRNSQYLWPFIVRSAEVNMLKAGLCQTTCMMLHALCRWLSRQGAKWCASYWPELTVSHICFCCFLPTSVAEFVMPLLDSHQPCLWLCRCSVMITQWCVSTSACEVVRLYEGVNLDGQTRPQTFSPQSVADYTTKAGTVRQSGCVATACRSLPWSQQCRWGGQVASCTLPPCFTGSYEQCCL